jgi:predicted nucleic acid-binding protein
VAVRAARFAAELARFSRVGVDTAILIYHLDDTKPYSDLTEAAFGAIAGGSPGAVLSTISVTELLVKPYADGDADRIEALERFLLSIPNTALVPPGYGVAKDAARLRAKYGIRVPDALLVATARSERAQAFLTNDARLRRLKAEGIAIIVLDDYV